jgi:hypothetical protein
MWGPPSSISKAKRDDSTMIVIELLTTMYSYLGTLYAGPLRIKLILHVCMYCTVLYRYSSSPESPPPFQSIQSHLPATGSSTQSPAHGRKDPPHIQRSSVKGHWTFSLELPTDYNNLLTFTHLCHPPSSVQSTPVAVLPPSFTPNCLRDETRSSCQRQSHPSSP